MTHSLLHVTYYDMIELWMKIVYKYLDGKQTWKMLREQNEIF